MQFDLALENNLDLAIARYNLPIAEHGYSAHQSRRILSRREHRRSAGTPGGGVGGFGTGAPGAGAGGTTGGAGGAGAGASGLVQSTLGAGTAVSSYDPLINVHGRRRAPDHAVGEPADLWRALVAVEYRSSRT